MRTRAYYDDQSKRMTYKKNKDLTALNRAAKQMRDSYGTKRSRFYDHKHAGTMIALMDPIEFSMHPELMTDDDALKRYLDENPRRKILDVGLTYVKHKRSQVFLPRPVEAVEKKVEVGKKN